MDLRRMLSALVGWSVRHMSGRFGRGFQILAFLIAVFVSIHKDSRSADVSCYYGAAISLISGDVRFMYLAALMLGVCVCVCVYNFYSFLVNWSFYHYILPSVSWASFHLAPVLSNAL